MQLTSHSFCFFFPAILNLIFGLQVSNIQSVILQPFSSLSCQHCYCSSIGLWSDMRHRSVRWSCLCNQFQWTINQLLMWPHAVNSWHGYHIWSLVTCTLQKHFLWSEHITSMCIYIYIYDTMSYKNCSQIKLVSNFSKEEKRVWQISDPPTPWAVAMDSAKSLDLKSFAGLQ